MGILFLVALLFAWPTFGLSLVVWAVAVVWRGRGRARRNQQRRIVAELMSPMFAGRYAEFYEALDTPTRASPSWGDTQECGRHIANYIAHNGEEATQFVQALKRWSSDDSLATCNAVEAVELEAASGRDGIIHLICYRAIASIVPQNNLRCFDHVDMPNLIRCLERLEQSRGFQAAA